MADENKIPVVIRTQVYLDDPEYFCNKSWTLSYNLNTKSWISYHSYLPNFYIGENNFFYSGLNGCCSTDEFQVLAGVLNPIIPTTTSTTTYPPSPTTTTTTTLVDCTLVGELILTNCELEGIGFITVAPTPTTTTTTTPTPVNSVEWISGDDPPVAYSGGGTSGENIVNLSGTVKIIGTPATFRAYGYWAFLEPATGSIDVSISIGAGSRYVDVLTPNINTYSTDLIISAGTYSWSAIVRFFDDANQAGEGGIVWTQ